MRTLLVITATVMLLALGYAVIYSDVPTAQGNIHDNFGESWSR